ncbi:MAG TPA: hypothetical protein VEV81_01935 [Pyrinomonadaceae bacterium]|nr:hypothetical protein [Pyrinomonadaceae bacterium]
MRQLRNYRIYKLPGVERSFYLIPASDDTCLLYDCELGTRVPPRFEVAGDERIINWHHEDTGWTVDDLIDTGENYLP